MVSRLVDPQLITITFLRPKPTSLDLVTPKMVIATARDNVALFKKMDVYTLTSTSERFLVSRFGIARL